MFFTDEGKIIVVVDDSDKIIGVSDIDWNN